MSCSSKDIQKNIEADPTHFPNTKDTSIFSKDKIIAKLKRIKFSYQKAVDSGRQSKGGRVVTIWFDECTELWSGYPAVESMDNGIETMEEILSNENPDRSESGSISLAANDAAMEDNTGETTSDESVKDAVKKNCWCKKKLNF